MSRRSTTSWILVLTLGLLACLAGGLTFSALLVARTVATQVFGDLLAQGIQGIVSSVYLMAVIEVASAAMVWATQGPFLALSWVAARLGAWQGN